MNPGRGCKGTGDCSFTQTPPTDLDLGKFPAQACRVIQDLTLLFKISQALQDKLDLKEAIVPVLEIMAQEMGLERGFITVWNRDADEILIDQAHGMSEEELNSVRYKPGEGVVGNVVQTGESRLVRDIHQSDQFLNKTQAHRYFKKTEGVSTAFMCVPIKIGSEVVGTICIFRKSSQTDLNPPFQVDIRLLTMIAGQIGQAVRLRQFAQEEYQQLQTEYRYMTDQMDVAQPSNMIGTSKSMEVVYFHIDQVAESPTTVLLRGESGVGKELVAQAIHQKSNRRNMPFIAVNCAALPENLVESELFGHEKGAFTGASNQRIGRFEAACGGTLFLDEVGELPSAVQAKLLRVLQEGVIERLGGSTTIRCKVRLIAATNRPLEEMIENGQFREDLFYRLNVFPIFIPPLRERQTDILPLADFFIEKYAEQSEKEVKRMSTPAIDMLMSYHWPGNVRELANVIERAVLLCKDQVIHGYHLPTSLQTAKATHTEPVHTLDAAVSLVEREMIVEALKNSRGNMAAAARQLDITERQMSVRVKKYNIEWKRFK